jgi:hypothetical protein
MKPPITQAIVDEIDTFLATHFGIIINYDIKYRMGLGGGSVVEEDEE